MTKLFSRAVMAALIALTAGTVMATAEPMSNAYPYCLLGRGGGGTNCYFRTREECGNGCINNPAYVGDARARAVLAGTGLATAGARAATRSNSTRANPSIARSIGVIDPRARASADGSDGFQGWPTDYLIDRFGDHQAQGRF